MKSYSYLDLLALLGISGAHPGGFSLTKQLLSYLQITPQMNILDAGCGTGQTAIYLAKQYGCNVTAFDINPVMLEKAANRARREGVKMQFVQGNIESLPFPHDFFDILISESVLVFANIEKALEEMQRVLTGGGRIAAIEMTVERPLHLQEQRELTGVYSVNSYLTERQWTELFVRIGFSEVKVLGGGNIASTIHFATEQPEFDISPHLNPEIYQIWHEHEAIIMKYAHLLGHRVFLCSK
ncbi:MAG: class I SAM-dependent methyltransferase [Ectobacillus sp.]